MTVKGVFALHSGDIFICYSTADVAEAARLADRLENQCGFTCWYAERDMPFANYDDTEKILQIINECSFFLLISSSNTTDSQNVQVAVSHALALGKDRVELKIENGEISDQAFINCYQKIRATIASEREVPEEFDYEKSSWFGRHLVYIIILIIGVVGGVLTFNSLRGEPREQIGLEYFEDDVPDMFGTLEEQAREGDAEAQYELGRLLMIIQSFDDATYWFRQAAEQGHQSAQAILAFNYQAGIGVARNRYQAAYWFYQAGEANDPFIQFDIASMYSDGNILPQDMEQAAYWFRKSAEQNITEAQVHLGGMHYHGQGIEVNHELAAYWYRRAADMGDPYGQSNLGIMYYMGHGIAQSYEEAAYWYRKAAMQDMSGAQVNLGWMYEFGHGVDMDIEQALYWYHRAAELGDISGMNNYGVLAYQIQHYETAISWFRRTAELGDPRGMALLGYMYENGAGVERDYERAIYWYQQAQHGGPHWAADRLAVLLAEINSEEMDYE